jgi:acetyl-CoA carboxylase carboxyl transferase subunit alpha
MKRYYLDFERKLEPLEKRVEELKKSHDILQPQYARELESLNTRIASAEKEIYRNLSNYQKLQLCRHVNRPHSLDYIGNLFTDFIEIHGDRRFSDDPALIAGFARFEGTGVALIGQQKGNDLKEMASRNFGMVNPEGFRKAHRLMELAQRWKLPLISFIDTPGAFPGIGAEERGQPEAIASNICYMFSLPIPILIVVIGEGMSGGALGMGVGDRVLILEHSIYSVISPEGCIGILWKGDSSKISYTAEILKPTSKDLYELKVVDEIIPEPFGGAHRNWEQMFSAASKAIKANLEKISSIPAEQLTAKRYEKFRKMGIFEEGPA